MGLDAAVLSTLRLKLAAIVTTSQSTFNVANRAVVVTLVYISIRDWVNLNTDFDDIIFDIVLFRSQRL